MWSSSWNALLYSPAIWSLCLPTCPLMIDGFIRYLSLRSAAGRSWKQRWWELGNKKVNLNQPHEPKDLSPRATRYTYMINVYVPLTSLNHPPVIWTQWIMNSDTVFTLQSIFMSSSWHRESVCVSVLALVTVTLSSSCQDLDSNTSSPRPLFPLRCSCRHKPGEIDTPGDD